MTKKDLVQGVSDQCGTQKKLVESIIDTVFDQIKFELKQGQDVAIHGFGKFSIKTRQGRTGRNPRTGEAIEIPAKRVLKFSPAKDLKNEI
jgi:DNA-binding protein HU-beta